MQQGFTTQIRDLAQHDITRITPELVMRAAQAGDRVALDVLDFAARHLAAGMANVVTILAPHCIVIGGGVAKLGEILFEPMHRHLAVYNRIVPPERFRIVPAALGEQAGVIGAALWAAEHDADAP